MYRLLITVFAALFALAPLGAMAQENVRHGLSASGELRFGGFQQGTTETGYLFGDLTLSFGHGDWAVNLGGFGVVGRLHETYFDFSYQSGLSTTRLGFPRPAYDFVASSALTEIAPRLALENIGVSRSRATVGTMTQTKYLPYGFVFEHASDNALIAGSLHMVPDYDTTIAGLGAASTQGPYTYAVAVEAVLIGDDLSWNGKAKIQGVQDWGNWSVSAFDSAANGAAAAVEMGVQVDFGPDWALSFAGRYDEDNQRQLQIGARAQITDSISILGSAGCCVGGRNVDFAVGYRS